MLADLLVELLARLLDPVRPGGAVAPVEAGARQHRVDVHDHREVRSQPVGGPGGQPRDLGGGQVAPGALVGHGGVDVAVAEHDGAGRQAGGDDGGDVLGAVGREQQRLRARDGPGPLRRVVPAEHEPADLGADGGAARLAGEDDPVAQLADQPAAHRLGQRGLARPVPALDHEEEARVGPGHVEGVAGAAADRLHHLGAQREAGPVVQAAEGQRPDHHGQQPRQGHDQARPENARPASPTT